MYEDKVKRGDTTEFADNDGPGGGPPGGSGGGDMAAGPQRAPCSRVNVRMTLAEQERVTSHEDTGFRERQDFYFVEDEVWKKENPGKALPPTEMAWVTDHETGLSLFSVKSTTVIDVSCNLLLACCAM